MRLERGICMTLLDIRNLANETLQKHGLTGLPIDIRDLCNKENIMLFDDYDTSVLATDDKTIKKVISGAYLSNAYLSDGSRTKAILVSDQEHGEWRKRFTIAHELGHHFLHEETIISFRRDNSPKEREADVFAAEILMPIELIKQEYAKNHNVHELATIFNVSFQAMRYRLSSLDIAYYY